MQRWEKGRGRDRGGLGEGTRHKAAGGRAQAGWKSELSRLGVWVAFSLA